jgi:hypothetical protein
MEILVRVFLFSILMLLGALPLSQAVLADEHVVVGGDVFAAGANDSISEPASRDAIISGFLVDISGRTAKDAVAAGFDVDIDAPVGEDLYATEFSVEVEQPVGGDLSASGFNVRLHKDAEVAGNARLMAGTLTLDSPIEGALVAAGGSIEVNGTIAGDARLTAGSLKFGPDARIGGTLSYFAPEPIEIAASVVSPDRIRFERLEMAGRGPMHPGMFGFWPAFLSVFFAFIVSITFLVMAAGVVLALVPDSLERLRETTIAAPFRNLAVGLLTLGAMFGLVPVSAITLIGIPLIPLLLLAIVALWIAGYLVGVYAVAWRVAGRMRDLAPTLPARLAVIVVGLIVAASLNFVPFAGWLINLGLMLVGLGGIVTETLAWRQRRGIQPDVPSGEVSPPAPSAS